MDIENINKEPFTVADEMLASGVPIFYCDERCDGTDLIIREHPDGVKELVKVDGDEITVVRPL